MNHKIIEPVPNRPYCQCMDNQNMRHIMQCKSSRVWYNKYYENVAIIQAKSAASKNDFVGYTTNALYLFTWWPQVSVDGSNVLFEWGNEDQDYLAFVFSDVEDGIHVMRCLGSNGSHLVWDDSKQLIDDALGAQFFGQVRGTKEAHALNKIVKDFLNVPIKTDEDF